MGNELGENAWWSADYYRGAANSACREAGEVRESAYAQLRLAHHLEGRAEQLRLAANQIESMQSALTQARGECGGTDG